MTEITSPLKAIRAYCIGCSGDNRNEVKLCSVTGCELYPFRFGKNPYTKREMTPEQREAAVKRLQLARQLKDSQNP